MLSLFMALSVPGQAQSDGSVWHLSADQVGMAGCSVPDATLRSLDPIVQTYTTAAPKLATLDS